MKLVFTVSDSYYALFEGGEVIRNSVIVDIGDDLPGLLRDYMRDCRENREIDGGSQDHSGTYSMSISVLEEEK